MSFLKKKWFWIIMVVIGGGYWWYVKQSAPADIFVMTPVIRGDVAQTVSASASLIADQEIDLNFEIIGRVKSMVSKVGAKVSAGDTIATMEARVLENDLAKADAAVQKAQADAGINDDVLREARESQKNAKRYASDVSDAENQKVAAVDKSYENAVAYENAAQSYYDQVVSDSGAGSATAKSAKLTLISATNAKEAAKEAKDTVRRNRDVAVRTANNTYDGQKEKVKSLESKSQQIIENSALVIARSNYDSALANLEKATIKAPVNGTVTQLNYQKGEVIGSANARSFGRLLSDDFILEAKIPESDIASVKIDQIATTTFDALNSDEKFNATIVEIDPEATIIQDVVYYKIKLRLANIDKRLKPGMSGDIDIHIAEKKNVLLLPTRAVKQDGVMHFVETASADGKTAIRKDVAVGLEGSDGQTEIVSGVSENDQIIVEKK